MKNVMSGQFAHRRNSAYKMNDDRRGVFRVKLAFWSMGAVQVAK